MINLLIGVVIGFFAGVIISCILLAQKNLERMKNVEKGLKQSVDIAKAAYKTAYNESDTNSDEVEEISKNED